VIGTDGNQIGIMSIHKALDLADEEGLDLVEISPDALPPVCKIMDYGKYKYEQARKAKEQRKKHKVIHIKEIKMRPMIEEHDYQFKARHIQEFIEAGNKVKVVIEFRGRQIVHTEFGERILSRLIKELDGLATVESQPKIEGRKMTMMLSPASNK
jgi:translation initiation factor IF-3